MFEHMLKGCGVYGPAKRLYRAVVKREVANVLKRVSHHYSAFVKPDDLCFDIGANMGLRTEALRRLGARVVAVEPQECCLEELRSMFGKDSAVSIVPAAVGAAPGVADFYPSNHHALSSLSTEFVQAAKRTSAHAHDRWGDAIKVRVTTLDALVEHFGQPAFCKVDVEGFELEVLKGLSTPIATIAYEYHPWCVDQAIGCIHRLSELGNPTFNYVIGDSLHLLCDEWVPPEQMINILEQRAAKSEEDFGDVYARFCER